MTSFFLIMENNSFKTVKLIRRVSIGQHDALPPEISAKWTIITPVLLIFW